MADLPKLVADIPDDIKPMAALGIGAFMLVLLVLLHGAGLHGILVLHKRRVRRLLVGRPHLIRAIFMFGVAVFLMLALHIGGFGAWAYVLIKLGLVPRVNDALYFSANAYTTLGFGNVDLEGHWRNIAPIIGISGLFTFAWTTSALVTVVTAHGELIDRLEDEREREIQMRLAFRKDEWNALKEEWHAERSEREKTKTQASAASFFERRRIWSDEKTRVKELRGAKLAELAELRRKEREGEEALGQDVPSEDSENKK